MRRNLLALGSTVKCNNLIVDGKLLHNCVQTLGKAAEVVCGAVDFACCGGRLPDNSADAFGILTSRTNTVGLLTSRGVMEFNLQKVGFVHNKFYCQRGDFALV